MSADKPPFTPFEQAVLAFLDPKDPNDPIIDFKASSFHPYTGNRAKAAVAALKQLMAANDQREAEAKAIRTTWRWKPYKLDPTAIVMIMPPGCDGPVPRSAATDRKPIYHPWSMIPASNRPAFADSLVQLYTQLTSY